MHRKYEKQGKRILIEARRLLHVSLKECLISLTIMIASCGLCAPLRLIGSSDIHVPMIFVLAVMLISRFTDGYFYGIITSFLSVFCVNYIFTYPYFAFNFTISGYPITFISMLAVSVITSALTTQIKNQEKIRLENEREKMRSNLLRAISHDFRTPLTSIIGATSAISENIETLPKQKQLKLLSDVNEDAEWLLRMVENLLSITRMGDKAADIKKEYEAIEEVVGEAVRKFRKQNADIHVELSVPDELFMVPMDAMLIEQVINNLLHNAVEHGGKTTTILLSVVRDGNKAHFSVVDNGVGFSDKTFKNSIKGVFMEDGENTSAERKWNSGTGLNVCTSIIKAHGGEMTFGAGRDGGALIMFELPLEI